MPFRHVVRVKFRVIGPWCGKCATAEPPMCSGAGCTGRLACAAGHSNWTGWPFELDAGAFCCELPIGFGVARVSIPMVCGFVHLMVVVD
jgi:hypothetical protein